MKRNPVLSILIPTRNREDYAVQVIQHVLKINDSRFELVIYNNSDTDRLQTLLSDSLKDARIKYYYNCDVLSFVENFSLGISKCEGEYLTIIGDDDGINPIIIDVAEWAHNAGIEAITPSLPLVYYWPHSGATSQGDNGRLIIAGISCKTKLYDPRQEVLKLLKNGCQNYLSFNLAKAYHGVIKRTVLEEIRSRTGKFIGGLSPDMYLSIAASLLVKKVLMIDYPLTISGICKKSGSADSATGKHTGKLEQAPHFKGHTNYIWSDKVPAFYCVETIWGDSALAAIKDLKFDALLKYFNVDVISAFCLKLYPQFRTIIIENLAKHYKISINSLAIKRHLLEGFANGPYRSYIKAVSKHIFNRRSHEIFTNISDIEAASILIQNSIEDKNRLVLENIKRIS